MTPPRYIIRQRIESCLRLAKRPGTPAEGEAAVAAAQRLADKYHFSIRFVTTRGDARVSPFGDWFRNETASVGFCEWCGARFYRAATGRRRKTCSVRCRVAQHRDRHGA